MSSGVGAALAHRSVANVKSSASQAPSATAPSTPQTPSRTITSSFGSPSALRADDDFVILEIGSRVLRAGFAGDSSPKACLVFGPQQQRRAGDFRAWGESRPTQSFRWGIDHELWRHDLRDFDMGLFQDKLDRLLRDAFTRFLLLDSRPRRVGLLLDSAVPMPLLSSMLDTLFTNFQATAVSLMSPPTMAAVGAGIRSALVIDMGWNETIVTSVYEYREVKSTRTVRAAKYLNEQLYKLLRGLIPTAEDDDESAHRTVSFEECQDILCRLIWCRSSAFNSSQSQYNQLDTVEEQDEVDSEASQPSGIAEVPLRSTNPPSTIHIPFNKLADVCDDAFFDPLAASSSFDDNDLPLHLLVYQHLLQLPLDVRAICMSRVIFIGGCSNILGLKERIMHELRSIVVQRAWEPAVGRVVEKSREAQRLERRSKSQRSSVSTAATPESRDDPSDQTRSGAGTTENQVDAIEAKIARNRPAPQQVQGQLRAIRSLGSWAGASLMCSLKIPAMAIIDRDLWLQQGSDGASRPSEIDIKAQQRQSMGANSFVRGGGGHHANWTLGIWGVL